MNRKWVKRNGFEMSLLLARFLGWVLAIPTFIRLSAGVSVSRHGGRRQDGRVLPRSAFAAKGSTEFRKKLFSDANNVDLTMLLNTGGWVFDDAEPRYTIALAAVTRGQSKRERGANVILEGPYASRSAYVAGVSRVAERPVFSGKEIHTWNDTSSLPLLPKPDSAEVFLKLRQAPRLDFAEGSWRARPYAELHATNDADLMDLKSEKRPRGFWPVYKGESFDLWTSDTGRYYGWADPAEVVPALQEKRERGARKDGSPFAEFPPDWARRRETLSCYHARIAFRDVTRATDSRTIRVALVPPKVVLTNKAPFLLWPRGDERDHAYLLGVLSSLALDWYARRFVEVSLNYFIFNPFPIPRPTANSAAYARTISLSARLAVQDDERFVEWGEALGIEPAPIAEDEKSDFIHELDAAVAHLYGLDERHLVHIFETFHEGWDFHEQLSATLKHLARLRRSS
jgi:hypothetical protein